MVAYGIYGKIFYVIRSLYKNLQSCVRVNGRFTNWFPLSAGVRQGTLAPTLFAIFINDLAMEIKALDLGVPKQCDEKHSPVRRRHRFNNRIPGESVMNTAGDWSNRWSLEMNYDKTKVMHFHKQSVPRSASRRRHQNYSILSLPGRSHQRNNGPHSWYGVRVLSTAANRVLGGVIARYLATDGLSHDVYIKLFDVTVAPVMDYGCEVWGTKPYMNAAPHSNTVQWEHSLEWLNVHHYLPCTLTFSGNQPLLDNV